MPPSDLQPRMKEVLQGASWFVHQPYIWDIVHAAWWSGALLLWSPLLALAIWIRLLYNFIVGNLSQRLRSPVGRGAVLITGCDRGFGRDLAVELVKQEWKVYATCLTASGVKSLEAEKIEGEGLLVALQMDVTDEQQVHRVLVRVEEDGSGLYCLVNNAGVAPANVIDWMAMEELRSVFEVNFFAPARLVKACLPLLKGAALAGQGPRIVNVTSFAGLFPGQALSCAYASSKHAADCFSNVLLQELAPFGIQVCTLNPTFHSTEMAQTHAQGLLRGYQGLDEETRRQYGEQYGQSLVDKVDQSLELYQWDPANVMRALVNAVAGERPRGQYILGLDGRMWLSMFMLLPMPVLNWLSSKTNPFSVLTPDMVRLDHHKKQLGGDEEVKESV